MSIRKIVAISALVVTAMMPAMASAATPDNARCILSDHQVVSVTPYNVEQHVGYSTITRLGGADVHVRAEPGLTAQWLQVSLGRHLAEMRGDMKDCALDPRDVQVDVTPVQDGFSVKLIAKDTDKAAEILRRARLLAT